MISGVAIAGKPCGMSFVKFGGSCLIDDADQFEPEISNSSKLRGNFPKCESSSTLGNPFDESDSFAKVGGSSNRSLGVREGLSVASFRLLSTGKHDARVLWLGSKVVGPIMDVKSCSRSSCWSSSSENN